MRFSTTTLLFTLFLSFALLAVHADAEEATKARKCRSRMAIKKTKNHVNAAKSNGLHPQNHHKLNHEMQQLNHKQVHEANKKSPSTQSHGHGHGHRSNVTATASPSTSSPTGTSTTSSNGQNGQDGQDGQDGTSSTTTGTEDEDEDENEDEDEDEDASADNNGSSQQDEDEDEGTDTDTSSNANATPSGSKKTSTKDGHDGILSIHNTKRAQLSVAPLKWDTTMAAFAKQYASKCHWGHSHNKKYAENIAAATDFSSTKSTKLFNMWWQEGKQCDFKTTGCSFGSAGHYVNLINKKYTKLGCATASCPASFMGGGRRRSSGDSKYIVCEYA